MRANRVTNWFSICPLLKKFFLVPQVGFQVWDFYHGKFGPQLFENMRSMWCLSWKPHIICSVCFKAVDRLLWSLDGTVVQSVGGLVVPQGWWLGKFCKICLVPECLPTHFPLSQKLPLSSAQHCFFTKAGFLPWSHSLSYFRKASGRAPGGDQPFTSFFVPSLPSF